MKKIFLILLITLLAYSQDSTTIGQLTNLSTLSNTDLFPIEQSDSTRNITYKQLRDSIYQQMSGEISVDTGGAATIPFIDAIKVSGENKVDGAEIDTNSIPLANLADGDYGDFAKSTTFILDNGTVTSAKITNDVKSTHTRYLAPSYSYGYGNNLLYSKLISSNTIYFQIPISHYQYGSSMAIDSIEVDCYGDASSYIDYAKIINHSYGSSTVKWIESTNDTFSGSNETITYTTNYNLSSDNDILLEFGVVVNDSVKFYSFNIYTSANSYDIEKPDFDTTNVYAWWIATEGVTKDANDSVTVWTDRVNSKTITFDNNYQSYYNASNKSIDFNGTSSFGYAATNAGTNKSAYFLAEIISHSGATGYLWYVSQSDVGTTSRQGIWESSSYTYFAYAGGYRERYLANIEDAGSVQMLSSYGFADSTAAYKDGVRLNLDTPSAMLTSTATYMQFGAIAEGDNDNPTGFLNMKIKEIILFDTNDQSKRVEIEEYWRDKYGL